MFPQPPSDPSMSTLKPVSLPIVLWINSKLKVAYKVVFVMLPPHLSPPGSPLQQLEVPCGWQALCPRQRGQHMSILLPPARSRSSSDKTPGRRPPLLFCCFSLPTKSLLPLLCTLLASYGIIFHQTLTTSSLPEHLTYYFCCNCPELVCLGFSCLHLQHPPQNRIWPGISTLNKPVKWAW